MAQAERTVTVSWHGSLLEGSGTIETTTSDAFSSLPVTWASRTERDDGRTSPEELLAAAHASCYAMAFSNVLAQGGHPADRLDVSATVGFDPKPGGGGFYVSGSRLTVRGRVPGMDQAAFEEAARQGEQGCPISNAIRNNVPIELEATLEA